MAQTAVLPVCLYGIQDCVYLFTILLSGMPPKAKTTVEPIPDASEVGIVPMPARRGRKRAGEPFPEDMCSAVVQNLSKPSSAM